MKKRLTLLAAAALVCAALVWFTPSALDVRAAVPERALDYDNVITGGTAESLVLPAVFGDGMLLQQNQPVTVWGAGRTGTEVTVKLEKGGNTVETKTVSVAGGKWQIDLSPVAASFDPYTLTVTDGEVSRQISDVLFGELYLSCGQSNMAFNVRYCSNADELMAARYPNIRFFMAPEDGGAAKYPFRPQFYHPGGSWGRGDSPVLVGGVSAVSYNFAVTLYESLNKGGDVPVGFLNAAKGATSIEAWLSGTGVNEQAEVKAYLESKNRLPSEETWNQAGQNNFNQTTAMFNAKIAPLSKLKIRGILWYQGENNVGNEVAGQYYRHALGELMKDWSRWFGYETNLPFIFAHLTPHNYNYTPDAEAYMWEGMSDAWRDNAATAAQVTTYDVPLDWFNPDFAYRSPIHPMVKKPVGERMAAAALGLVYGKNKHYTAPVYESTTREGSSLILSFRGGPLSTTDGLGPKHLSVCGADRKFYPASAAITAEGNLTVSSPFVAEPVAAAYAFGTMISGANLCGPGGLPVVPFRTDRTESQFYYPKEWHACDSLDLFISEGSGTSEDLAGMRAAYSATGRNELSISPDAAAGRSVEMRYTLYGREEFGFSPILHQAGVDEQLGAFETLGFYLKNPENRKKSLTEARVTLAGGAEGALYFAETDSTSAEIPADMTEFQEYRLDLTRLKTADGDLPLTDLRGTITRLDLVFRDTASGRLLIDEFSLGGMDLPAPEPQPDPTPEPGPDKSDETEKKGCGSGAAGAAVLLSLAGGAVLIRRR